MKAMKAILANMHLNEQRARNLLAEIASAQEVEGNTEALEELVSRTGHLLTYSAMEVVRQMSGISSPRALKKEDNHECSQLHKMALACVEFQESPQNIETRAEALLQASRSWAGRGLVQCVISNSSHLPRLASELTKVQKGTPALSQGELQTLVSKVHKQCMDCLDFTGSKV